MQLVWGGIDTQATYQKQGGKKTPPNNNHHTTTHAVEDDRGAGDAGVVWALVQHRERLLEVAVQHLGQVLCVYVCCAHVSF
jgi:hypothetical protein